MSIHKIQELPWSRFSFTLNVAKEDLTRPSQDLLDVTNFDTKSKNQIILMSLLNIVVIEYFNIKEYDNFFLTGNFENYVPKSQYVLCTLGDSGVF